MNIHDIFSDTVIAGVVIPLMYILKMYFRPNEAEAKIISNLLIGVIMLIMKFARRWVEHHKLQLDNIHAEFVSLRDKIKKSKVKVG